MQSIAKCKLRVWIKFPRKKSRARQIAQPVPRFAKRFRRINGLRRPCCSRSGEVEVGFASQKNFIGFCILRLSVHRDLLKAKTSEFCKILFVIQSLKYRLAVVETMLKETQVSIGVICGHSAG
jgi:hypothetical protein